MGLFCLATEILQTVGIFSINSKLKKSLVSSDQNLEKHPNFDDLIGYEVSKKSYLKKL